jgi:TolB protein
MKLTARASTRLIILIVLVLFLLNLSALAWLGWPALQERGWVGVRPAQSPSPTAPDSTFPAGSPSPVPTSSSVPVSTAPPLSLGSQPGDLGTQGVLLLSLRDGVYTRLFAYHPGLLPLTRLSHSEWDEVDPAVSPDGRRLAFASRRNGYWDLYVRDLVSGQVERITDTPEYEGRPSWSPDGQWLVFAAMYDGDLDIYLLSLLDRAQAPILLTDDPAADTSPSWSPQGRKIAFVSTRLGASHIWIADLDRTDAQRFLQISRAPLDSAAFPVWSPDGQSLAFAARLESEHRLLVWDSRTPELPPAWSGYGDRPLWNPAGDLLFASLQAPNNATLGLYERATARLLTPHFQLPGQVYGLAWVPTLPPGWLADVIARGDTRLSGPLTQPILTLAPNPPQGRVGLVALADVSAPSPLLSDAADEAFQALRLQAAFDSGWDILSSLEQAYLPLTTPATPSMREEWLYTGRAFAINSLILSAGWMAVAREDDGGQTYWRVYLKTRYQDGSAGTPLDVPVWDLNARFNGDPNTYETGGALASVPSGYWVDLTELAQRYGWERLPAQPNWRTFFPAARFNQFVYREGLDWYAAMAQLYPPEALATPTSMPSPTSTFTPTQGATRFRTTFTPSPTITASPTRRPTLTLQP